MKDLILNTKEVILRSLIPSYRKLSIELERTNRELDQETAEKNRYRRKINSLELERDDLIYRCFDCIETIENSRLKQETKTKIIKKLKGIK